MQHKPHHRAGKRNNKTSRDWGKQLNAYVRVSLAQGGNLRCSVHPGMPRDEPHERPDVSETAVLLPEQDDGVEIVWRFKENGSHAGKTCEGRLCVPTGVANDGVDTYTEEGEFREDRTIVAEFDVVSRLSDGNTELVGRKQATMVLNGPETTVETNCHGGCGCRLYGSDQFCCSTTYECSSPGSGELRVVDRDDETIGHYDPRANKFYEGDRSLRDWCRSEPAVSLDGAVAVCVSHGRVVRFTVPIEWCGGCVTEHSKIISEL